MKRYFVVIITRIALAQIKAIIKYMEEQHEFDRKSDV